MAVVVPPVALSTELIYNVVAGMKEGGQVLLGGLHCKVVRNFFGAQVCECSPPSVNLYFPCTNLGPRGGMFTKPVV